MALPFGIAGAWGAGDALMGGGGVLVVAVADCTKSVIALARVRLASR